jgi:hypothetical protein
MRVRSPPRAVRPHVLFQGKDAALIVQQEKTIHPTTLPVWLFTRAGVELRTLVRPENDDLVLDLLGTHLKNQNYKVSVARFTVNGLSVGFTGHREPSAPVLLGTEP